VCLGRTERTGLPGHDSKDQAVGIGEVGIGELGTGEVETGELGTRVKEQNS
jgi:hypothetical protein